MHLLSTTIREDDLQSSRGLGNAKGCADKLANNVSLKSMRRSSSKIKFGMRPPPKVLARFQSNPSKETGC